MAEKAQFEFREIETAAPEAEQESLVSIRRTVLRV